MNIEEGLAVNKDTVDVNHKTMQDRKSTWLQGVIRIQYISDWNNRGIKKSAVLILTPQNRSDSIYNVRSNPQNVDEESKVFESDVNWLPKDRIERQLSNQVLISKSFSYDIRARQSRN